MQLTLAVEQKVCFVMCCVVCGVPCTGIGNLQLTSAYCVLNRSLKPKHDDSNKVYYICTYMHIFVPLFLSDW